MLVAGLLWVALPTLLGRSGTRPLGAGMLVAGILVPHASILVPRLTPLSQQLFGLIDVVPRSGITHQHTLTKLLLMSVVYKVCSSHFCVM